MGDRALKCIESGDSALIGLDETTYGRYQDIALLAEGFTGLYVVQSDDPGLCALLPCGAVPCHIDLDVGINAEPLCDVLNILEDFRLIGKEFRKTRIRRE